MIEIEINNEINKENNKENNKEKNRCIICLEDETKESEYIINSRCNCVYYYCKICKTIVENLEKCPLCRINLEQENINRNINTNIEINIEEDEEVELNYNDSMNLITRYLYSIMCAVIDMIILYYLLYNDSRINYYNMKYMVDKDLMNRETQINIIKSFSIVKASNMIINIGCIIFIISNITMYIKSRIRSICNRLSVYMIINLVDLIYNISYNYVLLESDKKYKREYFKDNITIDYLMNNNIVRKNEYDMYGLENYDKLFYKVIIIILFISIINSIKIGYNRDRKKYIKNFLIYLGSIFFIMFSLYQITYNSYYSHYNK